MSMGSSSPTTNAGGLPENAQGQNLSSMLPGYTPPLPSLANSYLQNLNSGFINLPTFQQMYGAYQQAANQQSQQAAANITESFGTQGGRYSSDLLRALGANQQQTALQLAPLSQNFLLNLRGQQAGEIQNASAGLIGQNDLAMQYLFQDYLRRTSPPPLLGAAGTQPGSPPPPVGF